MLDISQRNGTLLADRKAKDHLPLPSSSKCQSKGPYSKDCLSPPLVYAEETRGAISCSDGLDQTNMTKAEFLEYWQQTRRESVYLGDYWPLSRLLCIFWKLRPKSTPLGIFCPF